MLINIPSCVLPYPKALFGCCKPFTHFETIVLLRKNYLFKSFEPSFQKGTLDHGDGKFLGTMECQWFSSRYHCGQWFFNGFFLLVNHRCRWFSTSQPLVSMVFPMFFSLETMVFQWFFAVEPLVSMVFLPLNHWYQWFVQWLLTVEKTSDGHQWFTE